MEGFEKNESPEKGFQVPLEELEGSLRDAKIGVPDDMLDASADMLAMLEDSNNVNSYNSLVALTGEFNEFMQLIYSDYNNRPEEWNEDGIDSPSVLASYLPFVLYLNARRVIESGSDFKDKDKSVALLVDIEEHYKWFMKSSGKSSGKSKRKSEKASYKGIPLDRGEKGRKISESKESSEFDVDRFKLKIASAVNQFAKEVTTSRSTIFEKQLFLGKHLVGGGVDLDNPAFFMLSRLSSKMSKILTLVVNARNRTVLDDFDFVVDVGGEKIEITWQAGVGISREALFRVFQSAMGSDFAGSKAFIGVLFGFLYKSSARSALRKFRKSKKEIAKMAKGKDDETVEGSKDGDGDKDVSGTEGEEYDPEKLYLSQKELMEIDPLLRFNSDLDSKKTGWKPDSFSEIRKVSIHDFLHTKLKEGEGLDIPRDFYLDPFQEMFLELIHHNVLTPMLQAIQASNASLKGQKLIGPTVMDTLGNIGDAAMNSVTIEGSKFLVRLAKHIVNFILTLQDSSSGGHMIETYCAVGVMLESISGYQYINDEVENTPVIGPIYKALRIKREAIRFGLNVGQDLMDVEYEGVDWDELVRVYDKLGGVIMNTHTLYQRSPEEARGLRSQKSPDDLKTVAVVLRLLSEFKKINGLATNDRIMITFCMRTIGLIKDDHELANFAEGLRPVLDDMVKKYPDAIANEFGLYTETLDKIPHSTLMNAILPARPSSAKEEPSMAYTAFFDSIEETLIHFKDEMPRPHFLAAYMVATNLRTLLQSENKKEEFIALGQRLIGLLLFSRESQDYFVERVNVLGLIDDLENKILSDPRLFWASMYLDYRNSREG